MSNAMSAISNSEIAVKEFAGQRVVTLRDIDTAHERPDGTARRNFNSNRTKFVQGTDYFVQNTSEAFAEFGISAPNGLTLITESGYLLLVKSFTDDLSWQVQRELVNNYFRVTAPEPAPALPPPSLPALPEGKPRKDSMTTDDMYRRQRLLDPIKGLVTAMSVISGEMEALLKRECLLDTIGTLSFLCRRLDRALDRAKDI